MKKLLLKVSFLSLTSLAFAQNQAPENWFNLDYSTNKVHGVSTERTYAELLKGKTSKTIVVAVIDGGTEVKHEDLKDVIWVNPNEIPGNGIDDDKNGYVDDINGWNFIGGAEKDVAEDNLEVTRLYTKLHAKYGSIDTLLLDGEEKVNYEFYKKVKESYTKSFTQYESINNIYKSLISGIKSLRNGIGKDDVTIGDLKSHRVANKNEVIAANALINVMKNKSGTIKLSSIQKEIEESGSQIAKFVDFHYNTEFDPRSIVGDDYENVNQRYYGNNRVYGPHGDHGTHVAGIIAAMRNNQLGMMGVADNVKIMVLRVVPDGDERDKDVANAIRYAVDNGATIINMSFGKSFSPYKSAVDEAVKYAQSKDVLLVHAAGNDNKNIDVEDNFPNDKMNGYDASNWIEVGASSWKPKKLLTAEFSNYGKTSVDVFAPGVDVYSCIPESKYESFNGTSMAAPVTAGVAAVLRSYFPHLTAAQVKEIILKSSIKIKGKVLIPGSNKKVKLSELCVSGGVVNLYEAVKLAATYPVK